MKTFEFAADQWLPALRDDVFPFFAEPANLQEITPAWLKFRMITLRPLAMRVGALIDYRLKVRGLPLRWRSEITAWEPPHRFVDEQRRGPYRVWVHEHLFEERDGGTLVVDRVRYGVPGGALINWLFVRHDIARIFAHRAAVLRRIFTKTGASRNASAL